MSVLNDGLQYIMSNITGQSNLTYMANSIELLLPSAHQSPQSQWQIDRFSRSCTAHGRKSLYLRWALLSQKLPLPMGISGPHLIHDSMCPLEC